MTSSIWINPPTVYDDTSPSNHSTRRMIAIVSSIGEKLRGKKDYICGSYRYLMVIIWYDGQKSWKNRRQIFKCLYFRSDIHILIYNCILSTMRPDKNYDSKIDTLRNFFRSGWVFQSLDQMWGLLGYANRAWARGFLERLVDGGVLLHKDRTYFPTDKLVWYTLFESVRAWLPFTPESHPTSQMDLRDYLIDHPASTFFVRVKGDSMQDAWIIEWDIVILDRSIVPKNWDIVIASLEGDVTLKYFERSGDVLRLIPANTNYSPIIVDGPCEILWVVCWSVRKYK